jgi:hypothetical protein
VGAEVATNEQWLLAIDQHVCWQTHFLLPPAFFVSRRVFDGVWDHLQRHFQRKIKGHPH